MVSSLTNTSIKIIILTSPQKTFCVSDAGISVEPGLYVNRIAPGSPAAREGSLALGDRILGVNGQTTVGMGTGEMMARLSEAQVTLQVIK